jgi:hypothetical protein
MVNSILEAVRSESLEEVKSLIEYANNNGITLDYNEKDDRGNNAFFFEHN